MGLFGGKDKKAKTKSHRRGGDDDGERKTKSQRKSRRIAAPVKGGANSSNKRRTSRKIQVPNDLKEKKPSAPAPQAKSESSSSKPLDLQSGQDDILDNSSLAEPGMIEDIGDIQGVDEILLDSSKDSAAKGGVIGSSAPDTSAGVSRSGDQSLIDFLINKVSMVSPEQAEQMRQRAESQGLAIDVAGVQMELFSEDDLVNALTQECWVPHLKVDKYDIRKKALDTIEANDAKHFSVLPVDKLGGILNLAMVNPLDNEAIRIIEQKTGLDVKKVVATRSEIDQGIAKYYGGEVEVADSNLNISQDLEPQRVTQMLSKVDGSAGVADETDEIVDIEDIADIEDIEDIDDLLGDEAAAVQPAIIESFSVEQEDIDDEIDDDLVEPSITSHDKEISIDDADLELEDTSPQVPAPAAIAPEPVLDLSDEPVLDNLDDPVIEDVDDIPTYDETIDLDDDQDDIEFDEPSISAPEPVAEPELELDDEPAPAAAPIPEPAPVAAPEPVIDDISLDDDEFEPSIAEPEVAAAAPELPAVTPSEPAVTPAAATPAPAPAAPASERPGSMLKKDPATSRFKAPSKSASKQEVIDITEVLEEEFQHAITHSKSHVFEKWSALQLRNRILNAVAVPDEMGELLSPMDSDDKKKVDVA